MKLQIGNAHRAIALKLIAGAFIAGALLMLGLAVNAGTTHAEAAPPTPTATVAPMVVGQPMMLTDASGNTIMVMQGSTFYIFPATPPAPK